jgi:hypothetical protein
MDESQLEHVLKKSKTTFDWNSIKEFKQSKDKFGGQKTYKAITVSKEVEIGTKGGEGLCNMNIFPNSP